MSSCSLPRLLPFLLLRIFCRGRERANERLLLCSLARSLGRPLGGGDCNEETLSEWLTYFVSLSLSLSGGRCATLHCALARESTMTTVMLFPVQTPGRGHAGLQVHYRDYRSPMLGETWALFLSTRSSSAVPIIWESARHPLFHRARDAFHYAF